MLIVSLVILVFLWHIPSAIVPIITIPVSVLLAFIPMSFMGISSNIMSLAGIAISIGVLVDGAIVEVENAYKKLELWQSGGRKGDFHERPARGPPGGRAVGLLLAARDRRGVPADLHPRRPGGPPLHGPRLDQEPGDGHRRRPGAHPRPGPAHALRADGLRHVPAALARLAVQPGDGGALLPGGEAPHQPDPLRRLRAGLPGRAAPTRRRRSRSRC